MTRKSSTRINLRMFAAAAALLVGIAATAAAQTRPAPRDPASRAAQPERPTATPTRPGQDTRPTIRRDTRTPTGGTGAQFDDVRITEGESERDEFGRRIPLPDRTAINFRGADVEQIIPFIAEMTGKPVIPVQLDTLRTTRVTLVNDEMIPRMRALDLLFEACRVNGIGVIEREDMVILAPKHEMTEIGRYPVLNSQVDVMRRHDLGNTVLKVFSLENANAEMVGDRILEVIPNVTLSIDANSNQIVALGDIALCQQIQMLVTELDKNFIIETTRTFRLRHADAMEVMENILDLFPEQTQQVQRRTPQRTPQQRPGQATRTPQQQTQATTVGPVVQLRITPVPMQNSLTITAKPEIVDQISDLIHNKWDLPRPYGTSKVYTLRYTDSVRMTEKLRGLLGQGGTGTGAAAGRAAGATGGQRTDVSQQISGIYSIEAYPDHNRIIVISRTEESFDFLDHLIEQLDQRTDVGLPVIIELKHADAVNLAEELNALLQEWGGGANIEAPMRGLTMQSPGGGGTGGNGRTGTTAGAGAGGGGAGGQQAGRIHFPWQTGQRTDRAPESPIIGQARIMPIVRQNALAIIAPPAHMATLQDIVDMLDQPGRQVMIAATVAEVRLEDALSLGLRWGAPGSLPAGEGTIPGRIDANFERDPLVGGNLFTSSILDVGVNVDVVLQALARKSGFRILQSPRIFTSDNKEAQFFDGSVVPFIATQQSSLIGSDTQLQTFDREQVGVRLNVRPRITVHGDIDLELVLELSTVNQPEDPARIRIDRRETTTQIIVKNGQTIVLSGILRDEESSVRRRIPFLGDIPIIGALFSSTDTSVTQTELIAFITPIIVENPSDNDENYNVRERERLRELSRPLRELPKGLDNVRERISDPADTGRPVPELAPSPSHSPEQSQPPATPDSQVEAIFDPMDLLD